MHEANRANVFKMAQWTKGTLAKREAPYSAASNDVTFVSASLQVNQVTGTVHPTTIDIDPDSDDDDEDLYNPLAFTESTEAASALRRAGAREMRRGRVFLARNVAIAENQPPQIQEVDMMPQEPSHVDTTEAARMVVDAEQAADSHLPLSQEFSQRNLDRVVAGKISWVAAMAASRS